MAYAYVTVIPEKYNINPVKTLINISRVESFAEYRDNTWLNFFGNSFSVKESIGEILDSAFELEISEKADEV